MAKLLYLVTAFLCFAIAAAHAISGSALAVDPLMASSDVPEVAKWLLFFNWHVGTVVFVILGVVFVLLGRDPMQRMLATVAIAIVGSIGVLGLGMTIAGPSAMWSTPAPYAFFLISATGFLGFRAAR
ncbi:MAG: hypothetical protein AAGG55_14375 [Pseudomonadota bacterium]